MLARLAIRSFGVHCEAFGKKLGVKGRPRNGLEVPSGVPVRGCLRVWGVGGEGGGVAGFARLYGFHRRFYKSSQAL